MWEWLHFVLSEASSLPTLDPWPCLDVSDTVFSFAVAGEIFAWSVCVLAAQLDLKDAVDAEGFVFEAGDCVWRCAC
jgi:hypothetical protein